MKKFLLLLSLTLMIGVSSTFAQFDAIKRLDFYVGYTHQQVEADTSNLFIGRPRGVTTSFPGTTDQNGNFFRRTTGFDGAEISAGGNISRFFGIKGDVSAAYRDQQFGFRVPTGATTSGAAQLRTKDSLYNFLGGVEFKNNGSKARITPFGHALVGVGYGRTRIRGLSFPAGTSTALSSNFASNDSDTGLAAAFGGGLDVRVGGRFGFRVIQVDYNPVHLNGRTLDNVRIGGGVTF